MTIDGVLDRYLSQFSAAHGDRIRAVIAHVESHPNATAGEISLAVCAPYSSLIYSLIGLTRLGILSRDDTRRPYRYRLALNA